MIITRTPLRISLCAGGVDLESYYSKYGGMVVAVAIDKYIYVSISKPFQKEIKLKYSEIENCQTIDEIRHPIIKQSLSLFPHLNQIEISSLADIPAKTGLGSSSSFTVGLLKALYQYDKKIINTHELAELACDVEINKLKKPIGKQDQYIASYGGITQFNIEKDGTVTPKSITLKDETWQDLEDNLILFFTGFTRSADDILKDQKEKSEKNNTDMLTNLHTIKLIGIKSLKALEEGNLNYYAELMNEHWQVKRKRSEGMTNNKIDEYYNVAIKNGALSCKLVGAGAGGFLLTFADNKKLLKSKMKELGLQEVDFHFDFEGSKVIL